MKKLLILLFSTFLFLQTANATTPTYCGAAKDTGNAFTNGLSNITGMNFLSTKAVELAMQSSIKKQTGSSANVEVYSFGLGSLKDGKFKKMKINSNSMNFDGVYISDFKAETACDYNQVALQSNEVLFKENFGMNFEGNITNDDLKKTITSTPYLKLINSANIKVLGQTLFKVAGIDLNTKNNRLNIAMKVMSPLLWGFNQKTINASTGLTVNDGKIAYTNTKIMNVDLADNLQYLQSLINKLNPLTFQVKISNNTTGYTSIKNVIIKGNKIHFTGALMIPKNS